MATKNKVVVDKKQELKKLEVVIEKNLHQFVIQCFEHAVDFTALTIRKQKLPIDLKEMTRILDLTRTGVDNGFMTGIDRFMRAVEKSLIEVVGVDEDE